MEALTWIKKHWKFIFLMGFILGLMLAHFQNLGWF